MSLTAVAIELEVFAARSFFNEVDEGETEIVGNEQNPANRVRLFFFLLFDDDDDDEDEEEDEDDEGFGR